MKRILIAEDTAVQRKLIEILLRKTPYKLVFANNGKEAIDAATRHKFDLVMMNLAMPVMDGFEASRLLTASRPDLPIIAFSCYRELHDIKKAYLAGCKDYIESPVLSNKLIQQIDCWLKQ